MLLLVLPAPQTITKKPPVKTILAYGLYKNKPQARFGTDHSLPTPDLDIAC